jgi:hypothetical protein
MKTPETQSLAVGITLPGDPAQKLLAREPILASDFAGIRNAAWLDAARKGKVGVDPDTIQFCFRGGPKVEPDRVDGLMVEISENGRSHQQRFSVESMHSVAVRAVAPLLKEGVLSDDDLFNYYITCLPDDQLPEPPPKETCEVRQRREPLVVESAPLQLYVEASELLEPALIESDKPTDEPLQVFVDEDLWDHMLRVARAGGENESAGIITGRVMRDTKTPELFIRFDACVAAKHAKEEKYAVTMSGDDWADARKFLQLRRQRVNPHETMVASVHGHNFAPQTDAAGRRMCQACPAATICTRTTAAASAADQTWHEIIFNEAPWATLLIWGFNAREQDDWRLYGLSSDGSFAPRPLRLLKREVE